MCRKIAVVNLEQPDDLLLGGVLNFVNDFRNITLGLTGRLEKRNSEEPTNDIPLVILHPTQERTDLVFKGFAASPQDCQTNGDTNGQQRGELARVDTSVTSHHPYQVGSAEQNDDEPTRLVNGLGKPAIDSGQFAGLLFGPSNCALAVPATQEK